MKAVCTTTAHVWPVGAVNDKLTTRTIDHSHRCLCGKFVVALVECDLGGRHKRVVPLAPFEKMMEAHQ